MKSHTQKVSSKGWLISAAACSAHSWKNNQLCLQLKSACRRNLGKHSTRGIAQNEKKKKDSQRVFRAFGHHQQQLFQNKHKQHETTALFSRWELILCSFQASCWFLPQSTNMPVKAVSRVQPVQFECWDQLQWQKMDG